MKTSFKIFIGLVLASLILVSLQPVARADGIPMIITELHSTLRENRQIAYITVDDSAESETLDLFLSVVSLEPGNNLTVMIPLRTRPYSVSGAETSEYQFRAERNYYGIMDLAEKQNHAMDEVIRQTSDSSGALARAQAAGIFGFMVVGMGSSSGGIQYDIAEGVSMELLSFNSADSLAAYYESQGLEVPDGVEDIIREYGDFNVGLLTSRTRPPIDRARFDNISKKCPAQLERFKAFVAVNPSITTYDYGGYYDIYFHDNYELSSIMESISDYELRYAFYDLISATYGRGTTQGTAVSFGLPLNGNMAFFPLGTTPAWNGVQQTQVIFEVPDNLVINFDRRGDEVFVGGNHYYVWDFGAESPDYDLEGTVKKAGLGTGFSMAARQSEQCIYESADGIGWALAILLYVTLWAGGLWTVSRVRGWPRVGKRRIFELLFLGILCFSGSVVLSIFLGIWIAAVGLVILENRYLPPGDRLLTIRHPKKMVAGLLSFLLLLTGMFCAIGFTLIENAPEISVPLVIGFLGTVFIFVYSSVATGHSCQRKIGAWFLYLLTMAPAFMMVTYQAGRVAYCTMAFFILLTVQTSLYFQMVKMDEDEPVEWRSESLLKSGTQ